MEHVNNAVSKDIGAPASLESTEDSNMVRRWYLCAEKQVNYVVCIPLLNRTGLPEVKMSFVTI